MRQRQRKTRAEKRRLVYAESVCIKAAHIPAAEGRLAEAAGEEKSAKSAMRSELPPTEKQR